MVRSGNADIAEMAEASAQPDLPPVKEDRKKSAPPAWSFGNVKTHNKKIKQAEALKFKGNSMANLRAP